jgi:hypothetical protein
VWQESRGPVPGPITNGNLLDAAGTDPPLPRSDRPGAALAPNRSPLRAVPPRGYWQRLFLAAAAARLLVSGYSEHSRGTPSTHGVLTGYSQARRCRTSSAASTTAA